VSVKIAPNNDHLFEEKTINCPPNVEGLFRYAEAITKSEIKTNKGQAFVLEMLQFGRDAWLTNQSIANKETVSHANTRV